MMIGLFREERNDAVLNLLSILHNKNRRERERRQPHDR